MSGISYPKPLASPTIFNPANFISNDEIQTINGSGLLEFPIAQGTQTFNELRIDNNNVVLGDNATNPTGNNNVLIGDNTTTAYSNVVSILESNSFTDNMVSIGKNNSFYKIEGMKNNIYKREVNGTQTLTSGNNYAIIRWETNILTPTYTFLTPTATTGSLAYSVFENTANRTIVVSINVVMEFQNPNTSSQREFVVDYNPNTSSSSITNSKFKVGDINDPTGQDTSCGNCILVLQPNDTFCIRGRYTGSGTITIEGGGGTNRPNIEMMCF